MPDQPRDIEKMSCDELLRELARLTSELDRTNEQVATPEQASDEQIPQVASMFNQRSRLDRIGELIKQKGCEGGSKG